MRPLARSRFTTLLTLLALLGAGLCNRRRCNQYRVTLYAGSELLSRYVYLQGRHCQNLDELWHHVASVDSHNTCVRLYEQDNCRGQMLQVDQSTGYVIRELRKIGFLDKTASVGPCWRQNDDYDDGCGQGLDDEGDKWYTVL